MPGRCRHWYRKWGPDVTDYGRDISCMGSLKTGRLVTGTRVVAEAVYRRLITPRGTLRGGENEADYGLDLLDLIGGTFTASDALALPGRISNELEKDERITSVSVGVNRVVEGPAIYVTVTIECTTDAGPFTLVLGVDGVTVAVLNLDEGETV